MRRICSAVLGLLFALPAFAQPLPSAEEVLDRSLAYHDPAGRWMNARHALTLEESRPNGPTRTTHLVLDGPGDVFEMRQSWPDGARLEGSIIAGACAADREGEPPYGISCDGLGVRGARSVSYWRDYYGYLYSLPMNLLDPGTNLDPAVTRTRFDEQDVVAVRVAYDAEVGSDTWVVYFDRATYAMVGYRFYHDEAANDGEYITLHGVVEANGFRLPRTRRWYTNRDGEFLGADTIIAYTTGG